MSDRGSLLFDLDGTLVDSAVGIAAALNVLAEQRGGQPVSEARVRTLVSLGAPALVREALGDCASSDEDDLAAFRSILGSMPADLEWVYPGVSECLQRLKSLGYGLAVVTNKPERLADALLRDLALSVYFDILVGGDTLERCKPHPDPLHHALRAMEGSTECSLMIGDSKVDAEAAGAARMPFVLFEGGYGRQDCSAEAVDYRFGHFSALPDLISFAAGSPADIVRKRAAS